MIVLPNLTGILGFNSYYFDVSQRKPKRMNIFQAVIRPFQTQTSVSLSTNQRSAEEAEREEDGFMIVAETESERTTVYASDYRGDLPPNYNQVQVKETDQHTVRVTDKEIQTGRQRKKDRHTERQRQRERERERERERCYILYVYIIV